jgi:dihydroorotate dehydrogenase (fumarate)
MITDLSTEYLGLHLAHPIVASASPLTATVDGIRALEDAGAAAVVMPSLFEEQVSAEDTAYARYTEHGSYSQAEAGSYFPTTTVASRVTSTRCAVPSPQSTSR